VGPRLDHRWSSWGRGIERPICDSALAARRPPTGSLLFKEARAIVPCTPDGDPAARSPLVQVMHRSDGHSAVVEDRQGSSERQATGLDRPPSDTRKTRSARAHSRHGNRGGEAAWHPLHVLNSTSGEHNVDAPLRRHAGRGFSRRRGTALGERGVECRPASSPRFPTLLRNCSRRVDAMTAQVFLVFASAAATRRPSYCFSAAFFRSSYCWSVPKPVSWPSTPTEM